MFQAFFRNITEKEKTGAVENIITHASPRMDFFLMMVLSVAMAVCGVLAGSVAVVIASMLIAPMLYPLLSFALGIVLADEALIARSFLTIVKAVALSLAAAFVIGLLFVGSPLSSIALVTAAVPSAWYVLVAAIAGFAGAFSVVKPRFNENLPGVAIAVSLVPPLAISGVGLAHFNWTVAVNAFLLFLLNVAGIVAVSVIVFSLFGFYIKRKIAEEAVKEDEKLVKAESKPDEPK